MKKLLLVVALLLFAAAAFGQVQTLELSSDIDTLDLVPTDQVGDGTDDSAFVYAYFTMTGISFQLVDLAWATGNGCDGDYTPTVPAEVKDVWHIDSVPSLADIAQWKTGADIPFVIENTGALAIDLAMYNTTPEAIRPAGYDEWTHTPYVGADDLDATLNEYQLFGIFAAGDWTPADEDAVKAELVLHTDNQIPDAMAWYAYDAPGSSRFAPATSGNRVYGDRSNLNLPAACGNIGGVGLLDYCQLRLRLRVGEGATDALPVGFQIALFSRMTEGL